MDTVGSPKKRIRDVDEIRLMPACAETPYSSESDLDKIIRKAEYYITTCYGHKLEEGVECNNRRAFQRSFSEDDSSLETDNLKDLLRTEISPARLKKLEDSLLSGILLASFSASLDPGQLAISLARASPSEESSIKFRQLSRPIFLELAPSIRLLSLAT